MLKTTVPPPRSDVRTRVQRALATSGIYHLRQIRVEQTEEGLLLSGRVDSFYHKQLAQELLRAICPDARFVNRVEVVE